VKAVIVGGCGILGMCLFVFLALFLKFREKVRLDTGKNSSDFKVVYPKLVINIDVPNS